MAPGRLNRDSKMAVGYLSLRVTHVSCDLWLVSPASFPVSVRHSDSMTLRMTGAMELFLFIYFYLITRMYYNCIFFLIVLIQHGSILT